MAAARTPGDDGQLIAEFNKNQKERVRVRLTQYGGHDLIDIRSFYPAKDGEEYLPGKGLAIRRELIPELRKALQAAEKAMREGA